MKKIVNLVVVIALVPTVLLTSCNGRKELENKIEGKVKKETVAIAPKVAGRIVKILVKEADLVKAGDTLAIIDLPDIESKVLQAEGAYLSAKAQYEMAQNGATSFEREQVMAKVNAAKEQFNLAEKVYNRMKSLVKDSLIAVQKYDEAFEKYSSAKAQLDAAEAMKRDVEHGVRREKVDMALGDMKRAEGAMKEAKTAFDERYILAPKQMTIESITLKEGELLLPGYSLIVGCEMEGLYFRFTVNEKNINQFEKGKVYDIEIPSTKGVVKAKLDGIKQLASYADRTSSYANYELGETVYELKLIPENQKDMANLYANMTVLLNK